MVNQTLNPKEQASIKKAPLSYLPLTVISEVGVALLEGALKYGAFNFRADGIHASESFNAAQRHLFAWWEGEDIDADSGLHQVTKAIAALVVLRDAIMQGKILDNRPQSAGIDYQRLNNLAAYLVNKHSKKEK